MITFSLRSSSIGAHEMCPWSGALTYSLGLESPPANNKASKGAACHRALELLARKKLAQQQGQSYFLDEETGYEFPVREMTVELAIAHGYGHYRKQTEHLYEWTESDYQDVVEWTHVALSFNNGLYHPENRTVVWPEKYFEFELPHDWARYRYPLSDGRVLEGQLTIRGTIDLVLEVDGMPGVLEMVDWKTGRRLDWATGQEKDWQKLRRDNQLLLYYYALRKLLPEVEHVLVTIVFIRDGGPFSLDFNSSDIARCEEMLREKWLAITKDAHPPMNKTWRCNKLCHFGRNKQPGTDKTICEFMREELLELGTTGLWEKYADVNAVKSYAGGGRSSQPNAQSKDLTTEEKS